MEIDAEVTAREVRILGVNGIGEEAGNPSVCADRNLPWLQDIAPVGAWAAWGVAYRDVWILDEANQMIEVVNLTTHDLQIPAERAELKARLLAAANRP